MDLSTIQAIDKKVEIVHPETKEPIGLSICVRHESHKEVKRAQRKNLDAQLSSRKSKLNAQQVENNTTAIIVAAVGSWDWYGEDTNFKGEKPECTPAKIAEVYEAVPWIKDQVREEFDASEGFFEA